MCAFLNYLHWVNNIMYSIYNGVIVYSWLKHSNILCVIVYFQYQLKRTLQSYSYTLLNVECFITHSPFKMFFALHHLSWPHCNCPAFFKFTPSCQNAVILWILTVCHYHRFLSMPGNAFTIKYGIMLCVCVMHTDLPCNIACKKQSSESRLFKLT